MKDIIGLAVLTSPLFLIVLWLPVALFVAVKLSRRPKNGAAKLVTGVSTFVLVFLLPFADEIAGRIYFNHLCSSEAGVKVYQTVELPAEYWDEQGNAKFYDGKNGNLRLSQDIFEWVSKKEEYPLHSEKTISEMKDKKTGMILNERILFTYWGGWIARNFMPHNTALSCNSDVEAYTKYVKQIFKPATLLR